MKSLSRRLDHLESTFMSSRHMLVLEDGERVYLERAADFHLCMAFIEAQAAAYETGEPVAAIEHPHLEHLELFARSVPRKGEGTIDASVRQWSRDSLKERQTL